MITLVLRELFVTVSGWFGGVLCDSELVDFVYFYINI
jgi:hypothetical protein